MSDWNETIQRMFAVEKESVKMFEYIVVNISTKEVVYEFVAKSAFEAMQIMKLFNENCRLYTAGSLNVKDDDQ